MRKINTVNFLEYDIEMYSHVHKKELSISADLTGYGEAQEDGEYTDILEDPEFRITLVVDQDTGLPYVLNDEETERAMEILRNVYWSHCM